ncbi:MAG: DUF4956 domain-containing protein [Lachnospiraceae bacterium]|nr:DUF4956 domain-containing protein [Lachnospiraceae bacterium]
MFEFKSIFNTETSSMIAGDDALICISAALVLGFIVSLVYIFSDRKKSHSASFAITLILVPAITASIIMIIGSDMVRAISLGGVFALVRFRSIPGDSKDISSVFFSMAIGLACGMGQVKLAVVITLLIGAIFFVLVRFGFAKHKSIRRELKITIPEDLNYSDAFDDVFNEFTDRVEVVKVKTVNLGTLYKITYNITLKKGIDEKKFIDSLRCRNGNLSISLGLLPEKESL